MAEEEKYGLKLRFKKFKGKTVEQMMFQSQGRNYLKWVLDILKKGETFDKIREILKKGENIQSQVKQVCKYCGEKKAEYLTVAVCVDGYRYYDWVAPVYCCRLCAKLLKMERKNELLRFLPIKFSSIKNFQDENDRKTFLSMIKYAIFEKNNVKVTSKMAFDLFNEIKI